MDIERTFQSRRRRRRRTIFALGGAAALTAVTLGLAQLEPAAPTAEADALWIAAVERGEMLREVRGPGTLVPESLQWIAATSDGRVVRVLTEPGTPVETDTVISVHQQSRTANGGQPDLCNLTGIGSRR